ncbi:exonuclease [Anaerotignum neopropionicum]|uniref:Exonuclease n=1 Tax=Anaerotignum neopropionicum TaxID=36847 RepID=A0A136WCM3_9FIRM|nr:exonuclease domain-containing protein [Anaerotignum neopropionicum]KXL52272.1 exonuclease [Anaerotignum neopropionicum]
MKYLFLDMEWNQLNNQFNASEDEILEISAICAGEDFKNEKTFYKIVKPEHIKDVNKRILTFLKLGENVLACALPIYEVLNKFNKTFPEFNILVVWNRHTYDLFINAIGQNGIILPQHKVIVLQELLTIIDYFMGFEKAMKRYNVKYNPKVLHCSKYDAYYLKELFCTMKFLYKHQCQGDWKNKPVGLKNSDIIHSLKCHYIVGKNSIQASGYEDIFCGYKLCKHCVNTRKHIVMPKKFDVQKIYESYKFSEEKIAKLCEKFEMECNFSNKVIFIRTNISNWRIYHDEEKIINIFHENYRKSEKVRKKIKFNDGYHVQNIKCRNLYDAINYIHKHDENFFTKKKYNQNRIDLLFDMLEQERIEKNVAIDI